MLSRKVMHFYWFLSVSQCILCIYMCIVSECHKLYLFLCFICNQSFWVFKFCNCKKNKNDLFWCLIKWTYIIWLTISLCLNLFISVTFVSVKQQKLKINCWTCVRLLQNWECSIKFLSPKTLGLDNIFLMLYMMLNIFVLVIFCILFLAHGLRCTVCLVEFSEGDSMKEMACTHLFHPRCLLPWLEKVVNF